MAFDDINEDIRRGGGSFVTLNKKGDEMVGVLLDVVKRPMQYDGKVVPNKNGDPRIEWLFTLEIDGEVKKWAAKEKARFAIQDALAEGQLLEKGGRLTVKVTKSSVQGKSQPEFEISYEGPKVQELADTDEPPF